MIELSFCIPTYNKGKGGYLQTAIDSILCQIDGGIKDKIEICISDDASTDNTKEIIETYQKQNPDINIKSFYFEKNAGAGRNYCQAISMGSGVYIWLMGGDDIIEKDSLQFMLKELKKGENISVYSLNCYMYFNNMSVKRIAKHILKETAILNYNDFIRYAPLDAGQITTLIFKKTDFVLSKNLERFYNFNAPHFYPLWSALKRGGKFKYISEVLAGYRCENSLFAKDDAYKRFYILTAETQIMAKAVFGADSWEVKEIDKTILKDHIFTAIVFFGKLSRPHPFVFSIKAARLILKLYYKNPSFYLTFYKIIPALLCPAFILKFIRLVYRKTKNKGDFQYV